MHSIYIGPERVWNSIHGNEEDFSLYTSGEESSLVLCDGKKLQEIFVKACYMVE